MDGDTKVFEGAAICLYLADKFPEANLAPKIGAPERGRYLSLMVYSTSQLEPAMGDFLLKVETLAQRGWTDFETSKDVIEGELGDGPYLFGEWFTAADIMIGSMFIWKRIWGSPPDRPKLEAYVDRLLARPKAMKFGK
jgi:glutathione S-transferase